MNTVQELKHLEQTVTEVSLTAKRTFVWSTPALFKLEAGILTLNSFDSVKSPSFSGWQIALKLPTEDTAIDEADVGVFLHAVPQSKEELDNGQWARLPKCQFAITIDGIRRRSLTSAQFSEKLASWGWPKFASLKDLRDVAAGNSSHHLYISVTLQPIPSDIEAISPAFVPASVELKPRTDELQAVLATMFNDPANSDIEFVFPSGSGRSPSKLYALKSILSMRCAYFKTMFAEEGFAEGRSSVAPSSDQTQCDLLSDDSDIESEVETPALEGTPRSETPQVKQEADDAERPAKRRRESPSDNDPVPTASTSAAPTSSRRKQVTITDFSRRTFGAMLYYLHTDSIAFAPPTSRYKLEKTAGETRKDYNVRLARYLNGSTAWESRPVSAKSIFRLTDKLGLDDLRQAAKAQILSSISAPIALSEGSSSLASTFTEIRSEILAYIKEHRSEISADQDTLQRLWQARPNAPIWPALLSTMFQSASS